VDGTGQGSCFVMGFGINGPSVSAARELGN
jgi:hypothetical protein